MKITPQRNCTRSIVLLLTMQRIAFSQTVDIHGQASAWAGYHDAPVATGNAGMRYIPTVFIQDSGGDESLLGIELSANAYGSWEFPSAQTTASDQRLKFYRFWARYATPQFEARAGLQRISFGSATLFRPLMWFDSIDPRDPLQLTDGVTALLARYYFLNNTNIWVWGVYGRGVLKGWEAIPSKNKSVEYGGRLQLPVFAGEAGLTFHRRELELTTGMLPQQTSTTPENRIGVDGKWDVGAGLWFEGTVTHQETSLLPAPWQRALTVGADYTFDLGTGLNVLAEYFTQTASRETFGSGESVGIAALSANYSFTLLDNVSGILYFEGKKGNLFTFLDWRRSYDNWTFHLIGFWNPSSSLPGFPSQASTSMTGRGFQVIVVFNH